MTEGQESRVKYGRVATRHTLLLNSCRVTNNLIIWRRQSRPGDRASTQVSELKTTFCHSKGRVEGVGIDDLCYTMRWYGGEKCVVIQVVVGKTSNSGGSPI